MAPAEHLDYIRLNLKTPIVLIGMMGAGKTTIAKRLAEMLDWVFVDSDQEIEKEESRSVAEIFTDSGEVYFRVKEKNKIGALLKKSGQVISVGGGAITTPETAHKIFGQSLCLWIDAPVKVLAQRTLSANGTRPLLAGRDAQEALSERLDQRRAIYEKAHIKVDGSQPISKVAVSAIDKIFTYLTENKNEI